MACHNCPRFYIILSRINELNFNSFISPQPSDNLEIAPLCTYPCFFHTRSIFKLKDTRDDYGHADFSEDARSRRRSKLAREMNGRKSESDRWSSGGPATRWLRLKTKIWGNRARVQAGSTRSSRNRESRRRRRNHRGAFNILRAIHARQIVREVTRARARALALEVGVIASRRKKKRINETDRPVTSPRFTCLPTVARCRRPNLLRVKRGTASTYICVIFEILSQTFL